MLFFKISNTNVSWTIFLNTIPKSRLCKNSLYDRNNPFHFEIQIWMIKQKIDMVLGSFNVFEKNTNQ